MKKQIELIYLSGIMKTKNIKSKESISWALPGNPISIEDFKEGIKNAEKGPFYTVEESRQKLVLDRFDKVRKNPERLLDWAEAKKSLKV